MTQFNMSLPSAVSFALSKLESFGHEAFVVGGAVRDAMLGRALHDYDITTSAAPEEIKAVFADFHTFDFGFFDLIDHSAFPPLLSRFTDANRCACRLGGLEYIYNSCQ